MKRVLIVGSGGIGRRHLKGYGLTGRAELAIVEPDAGRRAEAMANCSASPRPMTAIADADLSSFDLAVICAPANHHVALMQRCAEVGLAFMVEKPLAVTMEGVDAALMETQARQDRSAGRLCAPGRRRGDRAAPARSSTARSGRCGSPISIPRRNFLNIGRISSAPTMHAPRWAAVPSSTRRAICSTC